MKVALITRYGSPDVIRIAEVAKPTPEPGEVLIRVYATSVNRTDSGELAPFLLLRLAFGIWKPHRSIRARSGVPPSMSFRKSLCRPRTLSGIIGALQ